MTDDNKKTAAADPHHEIASMIDGAPPDFSAPPPPSPEGGESDATLADGDRTARIEAEADDWDGSSERTSGDLPEIDKATLEFCAMLDHSDTDNGMRLRSYFGSDILVLQQDGIAGGDYLAWTGTHWDIGEGSALAAKLAQRVGEFIKAEVDFIVATDTEQKAIDAGEAARKRLPVLMGELPSDENDWSDKQARDVEELERSIGSMKAARDAISKRKVARRKFAVTTKNKSKIVAMLDCAAPHLRRKPTVFNADPLKFATQTHTLRFEKFADPDKDGRDGWRVVAAAHHDRDDLITGIVPVKFDPKATGEKWEAFLDRFMPTEGAADPNIPKRRTLRQFCGLGLLGVVVQYVMFHYGLGANGKSVFLETLMRVLGSSFAVSLPPETLVGGGDRNAGGAAPDIMRLFGKRMLRVPELPVGKPLQEDLVKRITGGEEITARTLFKGYVDFQNVAKPHMSGNGFPKIDGTDNGIWRRMLVMHWDRTIVEADQLPFEQVVRGLVGEAPAILNWLIAGAQDFLDNGLMIAPEIREATQQYRDAMDTIGQFARDCIVAEKGSTITARALYDAYLSWCRANAKAHVLETKFGTVMGTRYVRDNKRVRQYHDIKLVDVPAAPSGEPPHPADQEVP